MRMGVGSVPILNLGLTDVGLTSMVRRSLRSMVGVTRCLGFMMGWVGVMLWCGALLFGGEVIRL